MRIEINLRSLSKSEKRIWVKATAKRKGHYRKIKGAKKVEEKKEGSGTQYEEVPGLFGKLPTYDSMPDSIKIPEREVAKMEGACKESVAKGDIETFRLIDKKDGKMSMGEIGYGNESSCIIPNTGNFGSYHTHPGTCWNTFSFSDLVSFIGRGENKVAMAHDIKSGGLWVAFKTVELEEKNSTYTLSKFDDWAEQVKSEVRSGKHKDYGKAFRNGIKEFCDYVGIKVYYGMPSDTIKEYDGSW